MLDDLDYCTVCPPGGSSCLIRTRTWAGDTSENLATRVARNYPKGTIIGYNGTRWISTSRDPAQVLPYDKKPTSAPPPPPQSEVKLVAAPAVVAETVLTSATLPQPGEVWRPKDPRRKASFTVKEVRGDEVIADDGRSIKLDRLSRYQKVS